VSLRQPLRGVEEVIAAYDFSPACEADRARRQALAERLAEHPVIPVTARYDDYSFLASHEGVQAAAQIPEQRTASQADLGQTVVNGFVAVESRP
jgi:hypothetical protein